MFTVDATLSEAHKAHTNVKETSWLLAIFNVCYAKN
jgi:hypothetical protein